MVLELKAHPALLKDMVTTPAGCTIDGLLELEEGKLRVTLIRQSSRPPSAPRIGLEPERLTRRICMRTFIICTFLICAVMNTLHASANEYDVIIRNGMIYDGSGSAPYKGDVAIQQDRIAAVGDLGDARGKTEIDAAGKARVPGVHQHVELGRGFVD